MHRLTSDTAWTAILPLHFGPVLLCYVADCNTSYTFRMYAIPPQNYYLMRLGVTSIELKSSFIKYKLSAGNFISIEMIGLYCWSLIYRTTGEWGKQQWTCVEMNGTITITCIQCTAVRRNRCRLLFFERTSFHMWRSFNSCNFLFFRFKLLAVNQYSYKCDATK